MDKVDEIRRLMVRESVPLTEAIRTTESVSLSSICRGLGCRRQEMTMMLRAYPGRRYERLRSDLSRYLEIDRSALDELINMEGERNGRA